MLLCTKIYYAGTCFKAQSDDDNDHVVDDDDGLGNRGEGSLCGEENHDDIICLMGFAVFQNIINIAAKKMAFL